MLGIGTIVKWTAIAGIVASIGFGIRAGYNYHLDQIDAAVNTVTLELALEQTEAVRVREKELRTKSIAEKKILEAEIKVERAKVSDLRRMLLIDHDLDRLLQRKPGLILTRVNKGTKAYNKALEDATQ